MGLSVLQAGDINLCRGFILFFIVIVKMSISFKLIVCK